MSAFLSTVLAILMSVLAVVYPAKPENVKVTVRPVTTQSSGITFECENRTRRTIDKPTVSAIEKKDENGNWQSVDVTYGWTDIGYNLSPGESAVDSIILGNFFDEFEGFEEGEYRLTVKYTLKADGITAYASGEFTVTDPS